MRKETKATGVLKRTCSLNQLALLLVFVNWWVQSTCLETLVIIDVFQEANKGVKHAIVPDIYCQCKWRDVNFLSILTELMMKHLKLEL